MLKKAVSIGTMALLLTGFVIGYLAARNNIQPVNLAVADQPNHDQQPNDSARNLGPSGSEEQFGTKQSIEGLKQFYKWDIATRRGAFDAKGQQLIVHEFDCRGENKVIYENNGVTIRSFPAVHAFDGPVSFRLDWNGLSFVFSSDTFPNKWFLKYAKEADDGGSLLQKTISTGFGYQLKDDVSLLGLGFNWGQPNEDTFGPGLGDQYAVELFSRLQMTDNLEVTPDVQWISNPALNPGADQSWTLGLRARLVF